MTNCKSRRDCIVPSGVSVGCINFPLREGNFRAFTLTFRKKINPNSEDPIIEDYDLTTFTEIVMDIMNPQNGDILITKTIGQGLSLVNNHVLKLYFGKETFDLGVQKLKYDIYFITDNIVGNTFVEGTIDIKPVVTKRYE